MAFVGLIIEVVVVDKFGDNVVDTFISSVATTKEEELFFSTKVSVEYASIFL